MYKNCVRVLLIASLIAGIVSCSDEEVKSNKGSIFPMKQGNYWIYKITITTADGIVEVFPYLDSVWIEKDTLIDNKGYWLQAGTLSGSIYMRDSANCVLKRQLAFDEIIYSTNRDTLVRNPPAYKILTDINVLQDVPAGKFRTVNCRTIIKKDPTNSGHDDLPSYDDNFYTAEQYICSQEIGLVKHVYYYLGGTVEHELVRYRIE